MSDLLNQASLVMIPSGYKEDTVFSQLPQDGSGDLSFTRASNGTRINSAGLVEDCPWNLLGYSEDFTNAYWPKSDATITSNAIAAPNGTTTADKLIATATNANHLINKAGAIPVISGQSYTFSLYAKAAEYTFVRVQFQAVNFPESWANFNLSNGTIGLTTGVSGTIESVGNGWYRCSITQTATGTGNSGLQPFVLDSNRGSSSPSYTGDGTSGIYIWGAQLNIGSTAKPYFPTTDRLNVPRLTYQNGGGGCPSLLLEKQSTNLLTYSEQLDNVAWSRLNSSVTANSTTSPDGTTNADKIVEDTANSGHTIYQYYSSTSGTVYTFSVFAKASERTKLWMDFFGGGSVGVFDLSNGTVITTSGAGITARIENFGNGWYRCSISQVAAGTDLYPNFGPTINNTTSPTYQGNGTSGIFVYGVQLEASSYPTSYIPTTTSSATRVADACFKSTSLLANQTIACFFVDVVINQQPDNYAGIMEMRNGTTCDFYMLQYQASNTIEFRARGSNGVENTVNVAPALGRKKIAMYRNGDRLAVFINGVKQADQTSATPMSAFANSAQTFYYNFDPAFGIYSNCININESIIFAGNALTDAELISLTTI